MSLFLLYCILLRLLCRLYYAGQSERLAQFFSTFVRRLADLSYICRPQTDMKTLIDILHKTDCVLVVRNAQGEVTTYNQKGVRDLVWLLDCEPERLHGAAVADKVIGKAAAGLVVNGAVRSLYADVMSRAALPLLDEAGIEYTYGQLVERIVIPEGDQRCPLEQIVAPAHTAAQVETLLRQHFAEMQKRRMERADG